MMKRKTKRLLKKYPEVRCILTNNAEKDGFFDCYCLEIGVHVWSTRWYDTFGLVEKALLEEIASGKAAPPTYHKEKLWEHRDYTSFVVPLAQLMRKRRTK